MNLLRDPAKARQRIVLNESGAPINGAFSFWSASKPPPSISNENVATVTPSTSSIINGNGIFYINIKKYLPIKATM